MSYALHRYQNSSASLNPPKETPGRNVSAGGNDSSCQKPSLGGASYQKSTDSLPRAVVNNDYAVSKTKAPLPDLPTTSSSPQIDYLPTYAKSSRKPRPTDQAPSASGSPYPTAKTNRALASSPASSPHSSPASFPYDRNAAPNGMPTGHSATPGQSASATPTPPRGFSRFSAQSSSYTRFTDTTDSRGGVANVEPRDPSPAGKRISPQYTNTNLTDPHSSQISNSSIV